jgi:hypothetical protein
LVKINGLPIGGANMARKSGVATGGTIHPIATLPFNGERIDVALNPGIDFPWEHGYRDPETGYFLRRDGERLDPTHWSPQPGQSIKLKD